MAQIDITKIEKIEKERNSIHEKVYATYSVFDNQGRHYIQLDTYGRGDRELPGKISQSIQLDDDSARYVFELLKQEYNF